MNTTGCNVSTAYLSIKDWWHSLSSNAPSGRRCLLHLDKTQERCNEMGTTNR